MEQTDWLEVAKAGMSTNDHQIDERNLALVSILDRLKNPLIGLFRRRLQDFFITDEECVYDVFGDFSAYLLKNRKTIFRQANPEKGKLRSFLFTIALRFFQNNIKKYLRHGIGVDPEMLNIVAETESAEKEFQIAYVQELIKRSLYELKAKDCSKNKVMYQMFKKKYFDKTSKRLSAWELAKEFGEIHIITNEALKKKVEDRINQRISKARKLFVECLFREIRKTLMLSFDAPIPKEEQNLFCKYVTWIEVE